MIWRCLRKEAAATEVEKRSLMLVWLLLASALTSTSRSSGSKCTNTSWVYSWARERLESVMTRVGATLKIKDRSSLVLRMGALRKVRLEDTQLVRKSRSIAVPLASSRLMADKKFSGLTALLKRTRPSSSIMSGPVADGSSSRVHSCRAKAPVERLLLRSPLIISSEKTVALRVTV